MINVVKEFLLGLALGAVVGWLGHRLGTFTWDGALTLAATSALIFGLGGWIWGASFLFFIVTAGSLSRYRADRKRSYERLGGAEARNWHQILASAAWGIMLSLCYYMGPKNVSLFVAFVGAVATATADAWATELGLLSASRPRLITTGRQVPAGTPGGVSLLGWIAGLGGAWLISFAALVLAVIPSWLTRTPWDHALAWLPLSAAVGGWIGCLVDSLLGATAQGLYYCERCQKTTEARIHTCGTATQQVRGWAWLTHHGVDFAASLVGAAASAGLLAWLAQTNIWW